MEIYNKDLVAGMLLAHPRQRELTLILRIEKGEVPHRLKPSRRESVLYISWANFQTGCLISMHMNIICNPERLFDTPQYVMRP